VGFLVVAEIGVLSAGGQVGMNAGKYVSLKKEGIGRDLLEGKFAKAEKRKTTDQKPRGVATPLFGSDIAKEVGVSETTFRRRWKAC
jgi:hypothetical protein